PHEPALVEFPVLVAIGAEPVVRIVVPLVREAHGDAVAAEGPELLDEAVVELFRPFAREERRDLGPPAQELRAIAPHTVFRVGERDLFRIPAVPAVFGGAHLGAGRFVSEWG